MLHARAYMSIIDIRDMLFMIGKQYIIGEKSWTIISIYFMSFYFYKIKVKYVSKAI